MPTSTQDRSPTHSPANQPSSSSSSSTPENSPSPSPSPKRTSSPTHPPTKRTRSKTGDNMSSSNALKRKPHPDEDPSPDDLDQPEEDIKPHVQDPEDPPINDEYADGQILCPHCGIGVSIRDGSGNTLNHWEAHKLTCSQPSAPIASTSRSRRPDGESLSFASGPPPKRRRAKRTEAERIEYLRNDPYVSTFEPYRVLCASCDKWIRLRPNSTYCSIPWDAHRKSCLGKRINNKNVYDFDRRNEIFSKDPDIRKFDPERLLCNRCDKWIPVPADEHKQALEKWYAHKATCISRGRGGSISMTTGPTVTAAERNSSTPGPSRYTSNPPPPTSHPIANPSTSSSPRIRQPPTRVSHPLSSSSSSHSPIPRNAYPPSSSTPVHPSHLSISHPPPHPHASSSHPHTHPASSSTSFHDLTPTTFTPTYESRRRNAEQRAATLRADGLILQVEPNRVFCSLCRKWVQLRQDSTYCAYPWVQHRAKCVARFQRRSEKTHLSRSHTSKHRSSSSSRTHSYAHQPHITHIDTSMPVGLDIPFEDESEEDQLISGDEAREYRREGDVDGDIEMSDSSSEDQAKGGSPATDTEADSDQDQDDVESEEGVDKPEESSSNRKDKGKAKETTTDEPIKSKSKPPKPKGKQPITVPRRRGVYTPTAGNTMAPPLGSVSRGDGFLQHHRADRGYRSIHNPHTPSVHPYASSSHPHPHPHPHYSSSSHPHTHSSSHSHSHSHPHSHPRHTSTNINPYPYRTPPPGPQSTPSHNARYTTAPHTHAKSRSMPYPTTSSTPTLHPQGLANAHHPSTISTAQRRHTDGPSTRYTTSLGGVSGSGAGSGAGVGVGGYRHIQHPPGHNHPHPHSSSHPPPSTSRTRPHLHVPHNTTSHHITAHAHPHRPTLETDGLVEVLDEQVPERGRDGDGNEGDRRREGVREAARQGGGEDDVEDDVDADGEVDPGVDEDEGDGIATAATAGVSGAGTSASTGSTTIAVGVAGTNGTGSVGRSRGSTRPGSSNGARIRQVFDLDHPHGRSSFIAHSISHLFSTTYSSTAELSIASLVAYVNAALPPDRYEDFDTREVSRAVMALRERGEVWYEVDIIKLVGRE